MDLFLQKRILDFLDNNQLFKLMAVSKDWKCLIEDIIYAPFFNAISKGKKDEIVRLLNNDPELYNHVDSNGDTPISCAHRHNQLEIAKYLEDCVALPTPSFDRVCDSNYSWIYLETEYFSSSNHFRNHFLANIKDQWGRNALGNMMSSIAAILSISCILQYGHQSREYRNVIDRAQNQLKKIKIFIDYGIKLHNLDEDGTHSLCLFLKSLSKIQNDNLFGFDLKTNQDKGAHYRKRLVYHLKKFLKIFGTSSWKQCHWRQIKEKYEDSYFTESDLLMTLTKWYPELGNLLPELIDLFKKVPIVESHAEESQKQQKQPTKNQQTISITLPVDPFLNELVQLGELLKSKINVICGNNNDLDQIIKYFWNYLKLTRKNVCESPQQVQQVIQKIMNQEDVDTNCVLILDRMDLDMRDILKFRFYLCFERYESLKVVTFTNRTDIVTLFTARSFYVKKHPSCFEITTCHPTLAKLRLTKGLRYFVNIDSHIKITVYFDSQIGVKFFQKIYEFLFDHRKIFDLSNRFRPEFSLLPIGRSVIQSAINVLANYNNTSQELEQMIEPFVILEKSSGNRLSFLKIDAKKMTNRLDSKIIFMKRYGIGNYLYDPFLICSVVSFEHLRMIGNQSIRKLLIEIKQQMSCLIDVDQSVQSGQCGIDDLSKNLNQFFKIVCDQTENNLTFIKTFYFLNQKVTQFDILYPTSFLNVKGQDIENVFNLIDHTERGIDKVIKNTKMFKNVLLESIATCDNICVPNDMIDVLTELNEKMRNQVNNIIKI